MTDIQIIAFNKIIGVTRNYEGENLTFTKYKEAEGVITVFTTKRNFNLLLEEVDDFLEALTDAASTVNLPSTQEAMPMNAIPADMAAMNGQIKTALLDALKRVQGEPGFIPQAKSVVDISNAMINLQKNELQAISMMNRKK